MHPRPIARSLAVAATTALVICLPACGNYQDVRYNPYGAPAVDRPILKQAEAVMDGAEDLLGNLDARIENWVY